MKKQDIITRIDGLYPIDSQYEDTNKIGAELLIKAIKNTPSFTWRNLPIEVLIEYERLCIQEEEDGEITWRLKQNHLI